MNWNEVVLAILLIIAVIILAVSLTVLHELQALGDLMVNEFKHTDFKIAKVEQCVLMGIAIANEEDEGETEIEDDRD